MRLCCGMCWFTHPKRGASQDPGFGTLQPFGHNVARPAAGNALLNTVRGKPSKMGLAPALRGLIWAKARRSMPALMSFRSPSALPPARGDSSAEDGRPLRFRQFYAAFTTATCMASCSIRTAKVSMSDGLALKEDAYVLRQEHVLIQDDLATDDLPCAAVVLQDILPCPHVEVLFRLGSAAVHHEVGEDLEL
jgi:hypothetical protein